MKNRVIIIVACIVSICCYSQKAKVAKADKLLKFSVDTGVDVRTVVSGVAESFTPEECIGKQVMILLNLAPRKIRGIESQGMLLLTNNSEGKLVFVTPDETVENGIEIG